MVALQERYTIDQSFLMEDSMWQEQIPRDIYRVDTESVEQKKTLSFNLDAEHKRMQDALQSGDSAQLKLAKDGFLSNSAYWAKEYLGDITTTHYYWEIKQEDDKTRLFHPQFGYADDIYKNGVEDYTIPEYERKRRKVEQEVGEILAEQVSKAHDGSTFIWISPPPEDVGEESGVYGGYTMSHLYEVREVDGKKILAGRDVKNRLSNRDHQEILESFANQKLFAATPDSMKILGTLVKTEWGVSTKDVEDVIVRMEQQKSGDLSEEYIKEELFSQSLSNGTEILNQIITLLEKPYTDKNLITQLFKTWSKRVHTDFEIAMWQLNNDRVMSDNEYNEFRDEVDARYIKQLSGGSCGADFGFDSMSEQYNSVFSYTPGITAALAPYSREGKKILCCTCPFCKQQVEAVIEGGTITCPNPTCKKSAPYSG